MTGWRLVRISMRREHSAWPPPPGEPCLQQNTRDGAVVARRKDNKGQIAAYRRPAVFRNNPRQICGRRISAERIEAGAVGDWRYVLVFGCSDRLARRMTSCGVAS